MKRTTLLGLLLLSPIMAMSAAGEPAPRLPASGTHDLEARIARVENSLPALESAGEPPLQLSLLQWMEALQVPGLSLAVIEDYRIAWARGYGVRQAGGAEAVTESTLFQAASISKAVTALAVLHQVERGTLALDTGIDAFLRSWQLPENEFTRQRPVTLRLLLSHSAGISPGGFPGYGADAPLPDVVQILNGEPPAGNDPARVVVAPGVVVRYSGLGYTILQLILSDQLGQPFPVILKDTVLQPLGMESSFFAQPLPRPLAMRAASGHLDSGEVVEGRWNVYPELAAAGLWSTPSDLAKFMIAVAKAKRGDSTAVLSTAMTRQLLTPQLGDMGLGLVVDPESEHGYFAHSGGNLGYRCHMRMLADVGKGFVIMANSDNGQLLFSPLLQSVAREYLWPSFEERPVPQHVAARIRESHTGNRLVVDPAILAQYVGKYELAPGLQFDVRLEGGELLVQLADQPQFPVYPQSETKFFYKVVEAQITFVRDASGNVSSLILHQHGQEQTAPKID